jgi:hypothetical protein
MSKYDPQVTRLTGKEIPITPADIARAVWLAKRFTSLTYIQRMAALWSNFVAGYEEFTKRDLDPDNSIIHRAFLPDFFKYQAMLSEGIDLIRQHRSNGYVKVLFAGFFREEILGRPSDFGLSFQDIGWQIHPIPHEGLYAWAVVAANMCANVDKTLRGRMGLPRRGPS